MKRKAGPIPGNLANPPGPGISLKGRGLASMEALVDELDVHRMQGKARDEICRQFLWRHIMLLFKSALQNACRKISAVTYQRLITLLRPPGIYE